MRNVSLALRLTLGLLITAFGFYRLHYIHNDWRSWLTIVVGLYFLVTSVTQWRSAPPPRRLR
jgi:Protein of unknown function (DUF2892)